MTGPTRGALRASAAHVVVDDVEQPAIGAEDEHHVRRVLRLRAGEVVSVTDGHGRWRLCTLGAAGDLVPDTEVVTEASTGELVVGFAPPKGDRPEWAVARLTELGVTRILPLVAHRSVVRWDDERWDKHHVKWQTVVRQAAMQSRQVRLPVIDRPVAVGQLLGSAEGVGLALAAPGGDPPTSQLRGVLIGPEGGWSAEEEAAAQLTVGLGPSVLRTETAAVTAAAVCTALRFGLVRDRPFLHKPDHAT